MVRNNIILILLIFTTAVFMANCKGNKKENTENQEDSLLYPSYEEYAPNEMDSNDINYLDSTEVNIDTSQTVILEEDENGNLQPENNEQTQPTTGVKYYVIVGSFKNYNNAVRLNNLMKRKGYDAQILPQYNEYNRVAIKEFTDRTAAIAELKTLRRTLNDATIWLLKR